MAFTEVIKSVHGARGSIYEIRMGTHLQSTGVETRSVYFSISGDIIDQVGWKRIQAEGGSRNSKSASSSKQLREYVLVGVLEGSGEDAGFLMLRENTEKGYVCGREIRGEHGGQALAMNVAHKKLRHYVLNDIVHEVFPEPVEFTVDEKDKTILIQCPDWLRYNPLSVPNEVEPVVQKPVPVEVPAAVAPPTFRKEGKGKAEDFAKLMDEVAQVPEVVGMFNRQERRTLNKKMQQHLRR